MAPWTPLYRSVPTASRGRGDTVVLAEGEGLFGDGIRRLQLLTVGFFVDSDGRWEVARVPAFVGVAVGTTRRDTPGQRYVLQADVYSNFLGVRVDPIDESGLVCCLATVFQAPGVPSSGTAHAALTT